MGLLAKPLGFLLTWIYDLIGNYGIAIIIFTVLVKICLYPVYAKQMKSTQNMSKIQPKMQELQQKYGRDKALYNEKLTELYKQEGVSLYGGCLPMVVQMFIIMGLFALLRNPMTYMGSDSMLFAIHEPFLWIQDLSQPDKWILPIGAGVATFISFSMSSNPTTQSGGMGQQGAMMTKMMKWFFPIMILWFARTYPSGLAIYWFFSQVIQIFYNLRFAKVRKREKELEEMRKGKKVKKRKVDA